MPVNEFEKQVQQKMDELQLRPSDEVWEEVEKRIRREKKRRRFILWFFLFGALLLGGAAWRITGGNKKQSPANNSMVQATADKKINETAISTKSETKSEIISEKKTDNNYESKNEKTEVPATNSSIITKAEVMPDKKIAHIAQTEYPYKGEADINATPGVVKRKNAGKTQPGLPDITKNDQPIAKNDSADNTIATDSVANANVNTIIKDPESADKNIVQNNPAAGKKETVPELKDSLAAKQTGEIFKNNMAKGKKNKWEFGIVGMAGFSGKSDGISIFEGIFGGEKSYDLMSLSSPTGPVPQQAVAVTVEDPANGFSWQLGVYAKRKLAVRTGISAGLNFSSYSTVQRTGAFVDSSRIFSSNLFSSSVRDFYRNGAGHSYKNHYYYLEIPFSFHWQINKGVKGPLVLQNGLSAGFFTGSDALVYNSASNVFYRDNKLFYKAQLSYQGGLYTKLFNHSKNPLTAGILFNYHLSKLQKVNSGGSNHLASFGVQLGWLLKK